MVPSYFVAIPDEYVMVSGPKGKPLFARVEALDEYHSQVLAQYLVPLPENDHLYNISDEKQVIAFSSIIEKDVPVVRRGEYYEVPVGP